MNELSPDGLSVSPASLRDPAGCLLTFQGRLLRMIHKSWVPHVQAFLNSPVAQQWMESGRFVRARVLDALAVQPFLGDKQFRDWYEGADMGMVVEQEVVPFPSFPYEWTAPMLHDAGRLTLDLGLALLAEGLGLKDATPYNVLFRGPEPVFVDLLSVEQRDPCAPLWLPYAQFTRTFLLPLLAYRKFQMPLDQIFLTHRDGLEPSEFYQWCSPLERLLPPVLTLASIPTWFRTPADSSESSLYQPKRVREPAQSRFILESLLRRLKRTLGKLEPSRGRKSRWSDYMASPCSYEEEDFARKQVFVQDALTEFRPQAVLDVGCNIGHFSLMAARNGSRVVAIDSDPEVAGEVWRRARAERLDILPLAVHLSRPTPSVGWRNREHPSFLDRARGRFEAVFLLAVLHHILVTDGIPLLEILDLAAELTTKICVIEFVGPRDAMFRRLVRGRDELYAEMNPAAFEAACGRRFRILRSCCLRTSERWLYLLEKKS